MLNYTPSGEPCGLISNIQKYTIHDGPGIRTAIFFKGCPMRCLWCSNPETISPKQQLGVYPGKCLSTGKCGCCVKDCPEMGVPIEFDENSILKAVHMSDACDGCLKCAEACPGRAIKLWGKRMTVSELLKIIAEDRSFYQKTGGGVTLNGGEVMLQWEFAAALLRECKRASIGTCVETALFCPEEHMDAVFEYTDIIITDIKHMDREKHMEYTGVPNERILGNIKRASRLGKPLVIRTPIVDGYNNDEENLRKTGEFIRGGLGGRIVQYQLLPYRKMGTEKYDSLGMPYPMDGYAAPERAKWEQNLLELAAMLAQDYGIPVVAGSSNKLKI